MIRNIKGKFMIVVKNVNRLMRVNQDAPVDQMGTHQVSMRKRVFASHSRAIFCDCSFQNLMEFLHAICLVYFQLADKDADEKTQQFHLLVAAMISSQTRDAVTSAAMLRLRKVPGGLTIHNLSRDDITSDQLADILKPVGFYRCISRPQILNHKRYAANCKLHSSYKCALVLSRMVALFSMYGPANDS
jgi:endonuclease III